MASRSKDLLELEGNNITKASPSVSSLESKLLVCKQNQPADYNPKSSKPITKPDFSSVPKSQVLGKIKDFLGVISDANERLQLDAKDSSGKYDIEVLSGNESEYIEMDLMLGVADLNTPEAIITAESAIAGHQPAIPLAATSCESESDDRDDNGESEDEVDRKATLSSCSQGKRYKPSEGNSSGDKEKQRPEKRPNIIELL